MLVAALTSACDDGSAAKANELRKVERVNASLERELEELQEEPSEVSTKSLDARMTKLEDELNEVHSKNEALRTEFEEYKKEYPLQ